MDSFIWNGERTLFTMNHIYVGKASTAERDALDVLVNMREYAAAGGHAQKVDVPNARLQRANAWWDSCKFNREIKSLPKRRRVSK